MRDGMSRCRNFFDPINRNHENTAFLSDAVKLVDASEQEPNAAGRAVSPVWRVSDDVVKGTVLDRKLVCACRNVPLDGGEVGFVPGRKVIELELGNPIVESGKVRVAGLV